MTSFVHMEFLSTVGSVEKKLFTSLGLMEVPLVFSCCFSVTEYKVFHRAGLKER